MSIDNLKMICAMSDNIFTFCFKSNGQYVQEQNKIL